jgi:hypothetical protein
MRNELGQGHEPNFLSFFSIPIASKCIVIATVVLFMYLDVMLVTSEYIFCMTRLLESTVIQVA